ncbi:hypothetical protein N0V90_009717 [Kalmusia sp. IMI 367209]|nr:hypothetical protein N0V90_009717 [Kalmusia sp. IMI 367209]
MAQPDLELRALNNTEEQRPMDKNDTGDATTPPVSPRSSITAREPATTQTHSVYWPVVIFLLYAAFTLFPWITLCIISKRPIRGEKSYYDAKTYHADHWYDVNRKYYWTARVMQSIAAVITIPVTTAICSMACVAYMQSGPLRRSLTLRQSMALADRGWVSPRTLMNVASMSIPLYVAFALTLIGSVSQVLQNAVVDQELILASSDPFPDYNELYDVTDLFTTTDSLGYRITPGYNGDMIMKLRTLMESPFSSGDDINHRGTLVDPYLRSLNPTRLDNLTYVPFGPNFSTGAYPDPQYAPRINSTAEYVNIAESEFKQNCRNETENGGFYALYEFESETAFANISLEACMTADLRVSPWKSTRDRQDITEVLYLRTRQNYYRNNMTYYKLVANTSLGYFELPGELNGNTPGPLLDKDPIVSDSKQIMKHRYDKRAGNVTYVGDSHLLSKFDQGPLATVALALFGPYSFIGSRMSNPSSFVVPADSIDDDGLPVAPAACIHRIPLALWLGSSGCIYQENSLREIQIIGHVETFLASFDEDGEYGHMSAAISNALYMANKFWLSGSSASGPSLRVFSDQGIQLMKPKISHTNMIAASAFLGAHLLGMLLLAVYVGLMRPWSSKMGSAVMVRMGTVYADVLARSETDEQWRKAVTELPGFIGDDRPDDEVGCMRLGAASGLSTSRNRTFEVLR